MSITYTVMPADPCGHWFEASLSFTASAGCTVSLPTWLRGSYRIRDFAKHVSATRVSGPDGQPVSWRRVGKSQLAIDAEGPVTLSCRVYAFDPSVRKAFLSTDRGFFNPSSLCWRVDAQADVPVDIAILPPSDPRYAEWRVATSLLPVEIDARGYGRYRADDYEDLIDHPVELGVFERIEFDVIGMPHALVLAGHAAVDTARITRDLTRICEVEHALFDHAVQLDRYLFLTQVTANGYGGLEHRYSTALVCARDDLPKPGETAMSEGYRSFLGLCSHEYFHLWNVKRLVPQAFAESALEAEAYTRDLWHYEGVTSYYDDLFLLRAGLIPAAEYLDLIARQATRIWRTPGRREHSLADASFEAWTKFYQPDESTPNLTVSYYGKGALLALGVDLQLRQWGRSLDEAMRGLWQVFGAHQTPVPEGALEAVVVEMAREAGGAEAERSMRTFMDKGLRGTEDLPLADLLLAFGVKATLRVANGPADRGGRVGGAPDRNHLGLRFKAADGGVEVTGVVADSPAERADLAVGDRLVALDGWQLTTASAATQFAALSPDRPVTVHRFRDHKLIQSTLTPAVPPTETWTFTLIDEPAPEVADLRRAWLGV